MVSKLFLWTCFLIRAKIVDFFKFKMSPNFQKHFFNLNRTLVLSIQLSCYIKTSYIFSKFQKKAQWVRYEQKMIILQLKFAKLVDCIIEKTSNVFVIVTFQIFEKTSDEGFISSNEYFLSTFLIILFFTFFFVWKL